MANESEYSTNIPVYMLPCPDKCTLKCYVTHQNMESGMVGAACAILPLCIMIGFFSVFRFGRLVRLCNYVISKSFIMSLSKFVSPSDQECGLFIWAFISTTGLQLLTSWLVYKASIKTQRADRKQDKTRGHVPQTAVKTPR